MNNFIEGGFPDNQLNVFTAESNVGRSVISDILEEQRSRSLVKRNVYKEDGTMFPHPLEVPQYNPSKEV